MRVTRRRYDYNTATTNWRLASWPVSLAVSRVVERLAGVITSTLWRLPHRKRSRRLADRKPVIYCYGAFHLLPLSPCGTIPWVDDRILQRRRCVPKHYIIWLLVSVLLAVKAFAFSPVSDAFAVRRYFPTVGNGAHCALSQTFSAR